MLFANNNGSESAELTTNSEKTEPTLVKPRISVAKPRSMQLRMGGGKSKWRGSSTNNSRARWLEACRSRLEPGSVWSSSDRLTSTRLIPRTDTALPSLVYLLTSKKSPRWRKSKAERDKLSWPRLRISDMESRWVLSSTGSEETKPTRDKPQISTEKPCHAEPWTDMENAKCRRSSGKTADSGCANFRTKSERSKWTVSMTDKTKTELGRERPTVKKADASWPNPCGENGRPKCKESSTDMTSSRQARLCTNKNKPKYAPSSVSKNKPDHPKLRGDKKKPKYVLSVTNGEKTEPCRVNPGTNRKKSAQRWLCNGKGNSWWMKSNGSNVKSRQTNDCIGRKDPRVLLSRSDEKGSNLANCRAENADSSLPEPRRGGEKSRRK